MCLTILPAVLGTTSAVLSLVSDDVKEIAFIGPMGNVTLSSNQDVSGLSLTGEFVAEDIRVSGSEMSLSAALDKISELEGVILALNRTALTATPPESWGRIGIAYNSRKPCFTEQRYYSHYYPDWMYSWGYTTSYTCGWPEVYRDYIARGRNSGTHWYQHSMAGSLTGCAQQCKDQGCDAFSYVPLEGQSPKCRQNAGLAPKMCVLFVAPDANGPSSWYLQPETSWFSSNEDWCFQVIYARGEYSPSAPPVPPSIPAPPDAPPSDPAGSGEDGSGDSAPTWSAPGSGDVLEIGSEHEDFFPLQLTIGG